MTEVKHISALGKPMTREEVRVCGCEDARFFYTIAGKVDQIQHGESVDKEVQSSPDHPNIFVYPKLLFVLIKKRLLRN